MPYSPDRSTRHAEVCADVQRLLDKAVPLSFALSTVQAMANNEARGLDMEYGSFMDVERIWERAHAPAFAGYHDPSMPCPDCGGAGCRCVCGR